MVQVYSGGNPAGTLSGKAAPAPESPCVARRRNPYSRPSSAGKKHMPCFEPVSMSWFSRW